MKMVRILVAGVFAVICQTGLAQVIMYGVASGNEFSDTPGVFFSINQANGALTTIGTPMPGTGLTGLAADSSGTIYASSANTSAETGPRLIRINPATGTVSGDLGRLHSADDSDCYISDLTVQPGTNVLFGIVAKDCGSEGSTGALVTINTTNALVTFVGHDQALNSHGGLAFGLNGTLYFAPCGGQAGGKMYSLNPANGNIVSSVTLSPAGRCAQGLAVRPGDGVIFGSWSQSLQGGADIVTINPTSGALTQVGLTGNEFIHDLAFVGSPLPPVVYTPVPTLSQWGMVILAMLAGGFGFAYLRRKF